MWFTSQNPALNGGKGSFASLISRVNRGQSYSARTGPLPSTTK